jgi:hypothetical protein
VASEDQTFTGNLKHPLIAGLEQGIKILKPFGKHLRPWRGKTPF